MNIKIRLPEGFLDEEIRDGYCVSADMKRVWAVQLDLLTEFMRVCNKHNLRYFATGGTLLGAARHRGFIPWDNDIDIVMLREDYDRLEAIAPTEFSYPYLWQSEATELDSTWGFGKVRNVTTTGILQSEINYKYSFNQGIFIDIFPVDHAPKDVDERKRYLEELNEQYLRVKKYAYHTTRWVDIKKYRGIKRLKRVAKHTYLTRILRSKKNREYLRYEQMMRRYNEDPAAMRGQVCLFPIKERFMWEDEWFASTVDLPFEFMTIPSPIGYEAMLAKLYGEWQTPVMGGDLHGEILFDVEKPYTEYLK